jgi:LysM repeat protein
MDTKKYVLQLGDSLEKIADQAYSKANAWRDIADKNGIDIFAVLPIGSAIDLPSKEEVNTAIEKVRVQALVIAEKVDKLDLSAIKQKSTIQDFQLISWLL